MRFAKPLSLCCAFLLGVAAHAAPARQEEPASNPRLDQRFVEALAQGADVGPLRQELRAAGAPQAKRGLPQSRLAADFNGALQRLRRAVTGRGEGDAKTAELLAAYDGLRATDLAFRARFAAERARLDAAGVGGDVRARLDEAERSYLEASAAILEPLSGPMDEMRRARKEKKQAAASVQARLAQALPRVAAALEEGIRKEAPVRILGANGLPYRPLQLAARTPVSTPAIQPSYLNPLDSASAPADLAGTVEAPLSGEILAKAQELKHDPVALFELVRNGVATEWYSGAMKGAVETLRQGAGNDVDQASLLIALFRASSLPARYVHGVVELPVETLGASLGVPVAQVPSALARAGVAHRPLIRGGRVAAVEIEHTWVAVQVPYTNYRGAVVDVSGETWLPLMPAIKSYTETAPTGVLRQMGLDVNATITSYLSAPQPEEPLARIRRQVLDYLHLDHPDATYEQQLGSRTIREEKLGILPSSQPAKIVAVTGESPVLAASYRQRLRWVARSGPAETDAAILDLTLPLSELAGRRVTLSYLPATVDDQRTVNAFGGLDFVPAYLVRLRLQIKVDGRARAVSTGSLPMGAVHRIETQLTGPYGSERVAETLVAGSYQAFAIGAQKAARLTGDGEIENETEQLAARLLSQEALGYAERWDAAERELSGLLAVSVVRPLPTISVVTDEVVIDSVLGLPVDLRWQGVSLDASLRVAEPFSRGTDTAAPRDFLRLSGLQGSALEHSLFENDFLVDSISADKGLGLARKAGTAIASITDANADAEVATLPYPQAVRDDIRNWARLGFRVEVPRAAVSFQDWAGAVWRVEDPKTGAAGYFLAGGLAGGATAEDPGSWVLEFLKDALSGPYSAAPEEDPLAGVEIVKLAGTDEQIGEVGKALPQKLAVLVRAADGRPVKNAPVTFAVWSGGGTLIGESGARSSELIIPTNAQGIASITLEPGKHTEDDPVYVQRNSYDEHLTRALRNVVDVVVDTHNGPLPTAAPFQALAYPGSAAHLRRTDNPPTVISGDGTPVILGWPGLWADTIRVSAEDSYGNAVSNVGVTFSVGARTPFCREGTSFQDAAVFTTCPVTYPRLEDCGSPSVTAKTSFLGTSAGVIVGNTVSTRHAVNVQASGLDTLTYLYLTRAFTEGFCPINEGVVHVAVAVPSDETGRNIAAARAGHSLDAPIQISLFYSRSDWQDDNSPSEDTFRNHWIPTTGNIQLTVDNGGAASAVIYKGQGLHESFITTGLTPALNRVTLQATGVQTVQYEDGHIVPHTRDLPPREITSVWGVLPQILAAQPDPIVLGDDGVATAPIELAYSILPPAYSAGFVSLDLLEDGNRIDQLFGTSRSGLGTAQILRGQRFDKTRTYTSELVLNVGSPVEIKSDPFELPFFQRLLRDVRGGSISQDVDIVNRRVCQRDGVFQFSLNQDADVTLKIRQITGQGTDGTTEYGPPTTLLNNERRNQGDHTLPLDRAVLLAGDWEFELTAVSRDDGHTETEKGFLSSEYTSRDALPVGHVLIQGVDLLDGNLSISRADFSLPGRGLPLAFQRSYSSNAGNEPGPMGVGWDHNYNSRIVGTPCGDVIVIGGEGSGMRFVDDGNGGLRPLKGYHGTLVANVEDHSFDFYSKSGNRFHYATASEGALHLTWMADPNGNRTTLEYEVGPDKEPRVAAVRDSAGRTLRFHYEMAAFRFWKGQVLTRVEAPGGMVESFEYDVFGNLSRATREPHAANGPPSRAERYEYAVPPAHRLEDRHVLLATHDEVQGADTAYTIGFGAVGLQGNIQVPRTYISEITQPEGGKLRFEYDPALTDHGATTLTTRVIDPRDKTTTYTLNTYGSAVAIESQDGDVTAMTWTPDDVLMTSRTNGNGVETTYTYDADGNILTESVPKAAGGGTSYTVETTYWPRQTFDPPYIKDRVRTLKDRNGVVTELTYDSRGNLLSQSTDVTDVDGSTSRVTVANTYFDNGDRATVTDARGNVTTFAYDVYGNLAKVTDALRNSTETEYDVRSRPVLQADALGRETSLEYDTLDRPVRKVLPRAAGESADPVETNVYDDDARTVTVTDAAGRATVSVSNREGRPVRIENAAGGVKVYEYDLAGNKTLESSFADGAAPRQDVTFEYSDAGRLVRRTEPLGRISEYEYDGEGNVVRETLRDGSSGSVFAPRVTEYAYDTLNRRTLTRRLFEGGEQVVRATYDGQNKIQDQDPLGHVIRYRYDALNRLIETIEPEWKQGKPRTRQTLYDGNGNSLEQRVLNEPANQVRRMDYDAINRLVKLTDSVGAVRSFEYDKVGNKTREVDPRLNTTAFNYDERNRLVRTTVFLNRVTSPSRQVVAEYFYDAVGNRTGEHGPNGNVLTHRYDDLNRLIETTDSLGAVASYAYDARGNRVRETDARGHEIHNTVDALDRLVRQDLPEDRHVETAWDAGNNKLFDKDARGKITTYEYDRLNRLVKTTDPGPGSAIATFTYDLVGNKLTEKDRRGKITTYEYDDLNRLLRANDPAEVGTFMSFTYDALGNRLTETDRRGIVTENAYDAESRLVRSVKAGVELQRTEYDGAGNKISMTDANGNVIGYEYDERNILIAENRPLAALTRYTLDSMGDRLTARDPEGRVSTLTYDLRRRVLTETNAAAETIHYEYDGNGNRTKLTRPNEKSWTFEYDHANRLTRVTDPLTHPTTYQYDGNGNRLGQTDANQHATTFEYDERNRMTARVEPGSARWEFGYDANGNRTSLKDPKGQIITIQYDALNRETTRLYPEPEDTSADFLQSITTEYDGNSNPVKLTEQYSGPIGTRITRKTYDSFDRLETVTDPRNEAITYAYDANGNRKSVTDPDGLQTFYVYDALNRLTTVTLPTVGVTEYTYFRDSRLKQVKYPNGSRADHTYDGAGRLQLLVNSQNNVTVSSFEYGFDANGNRIRQVETNGGAAETTTYLYDDADRLKEVTYPDKKVTYTYDNVANRLSEVTRAVPDNAVLSTKSFTYDDRDRLVSLTDLGNATASATFDYDDNGNQTRRTQGGVVTDLLYDVRDKLVEVRRGGLLLEAYAYDYQGLRIRKSGPEGVFRFIYDQDSILLQTDDAGNTISKYDYGPDRLLSLANVTEGRQFYLFDGLGSVTNLVRPDGALAARYQYDAWGNYRATAGSSFNLFGFTGHQRDAATGLYYFKARFYDPELGLFLSEDPYAGEIDTPPSLHRYLYAFANPATYIDLNGMCVFGLRCPEIVKDAIDVTTAWHEAVAKTTTQVVTGVVKGAAHTAVKVVDVATLGTISSAATRLGTFVGTEGSLSERMKAAQEEGNRAQLNTVTFGFSEAEDKGEYARQLVRQTFAVEQFEHGSEVLAEGIVNDDSDKIWRGGAEILGGASQVTLVVAGTAQTVQGAAGLLRGAGRGTATVEATLTTEAAEGGIGAEAAQITRSVEPGWCFVAGTLVLTEKGLRPIEEIQIGDRVWARAEGSMELRLQPVLKLFRTPNQEVLRVRLLSQTGEVEAIGVTTEHPFWVIGEGWVGAGHLRADDELLSASGQTLWVEDVQSVEGRQTVYNLEVASAHTYFVGESQAWVHNECTIRGGASKPPTGFTAPEPPSSLVRESLPELKGSIADSFEGTARLRTFKAGERLHRSPSLTESGALEPIESPGSFWGTRRTVTKAGTESQYNVVKWDNPLEEMRTYRFTEDVTVYYGRVAGGKGYQVLFPRDVVPSSVLEFVERATLK